MLRLQGFQGKRLCNWGILVGSNVPV
jgi:hypothetical protein